MNHDQSVWSDTQAVSPVMVTFVLILVGIIGGAGVAEMISAFASDVGDSSSTQEIEAEATIEIVVAGCEVVEPITEEIAVAYMAAYPGIRVAVQGGGSHAGVVSVGLDAVNIGAVSRGVTDDEREDYPDNVVRLVGGSAVVVIGDPGGDYSGLDVSYTELQKLYDDNIDVMVTIGTGSGAGATIVQRIDGCGAESMMGSWLDIDIDNAVDDGIVPFGTVHVHEVGNEGVLERVQNTAKCVGFVDYGFAVDNGLAEVEILGIVDGSLITPFVNAGGSDESLRGCVVDELKGQKGTDYPTKLARPMYYVTNGVPGVLEGGFIKFSQSPAAAGCFDECGCFSAAMIGGYDD